MALPDPSGPPVPVTDSGKIASAFKQGVTVVAAGGILLFLLAAIATPTLGGRRSARLKWREQQRQADEAVKLALEAEQSAAIQHE